MSITAKERDDVPDDEFAGPNRSFPISSPEHAKAAWDLAGHAENPEEVRRNIKRIAKKKAYAPRNRKGGRGHGRRDDQRQANFRFGHYPKKDWTLSKEDFIAKNGTTGTVPIGVDPVGKGHYVGKKSWFDGKTGLATYSVEDNEVFAEIEWPKLLDDAANEHKLGFSGIFIAPSIRTA